MLVLVTYDISMDDLDGKRRLRRVARHCLDYGVRVQNSVFECQVDAAQLVKLKHLIISEMDEARDSVRFYLLGNRYHNKVEHYGISPALSVDEPLII